MPLPAPQPREELHLRRIEVRGYQRDDGLIDIEARIIDTKSHPFAQESRGRMLPTGEHLHDMTIRLTLDASFTIREAVACSDATPHTMCPEAAASIAQLTGLTIGSGWSRAVRERLGGVKGCTHLTELLAQMATVAFQTVFLEHKAKAPKLDANGRPLKIDSCYAYASDRELVRVRWPEHYDGPKAGSAAGASAAD